MAVGNCYSARMLRAAISGSIHLRINRDVNHARLATGISALDSWPDSLFAVDIFAVAAEAFAHLVEPHILAPVHSGFQRALTMALGPTRRLLVKTFDA
jgi:hypothetical protein